MKNRYKLKIGQEVANEQRETANVTGTQNIDWSKEFFEFTMTGDTTFSDINLPTGTDSKETELILDGAFTPSVPAYWTGFDYDGTYSRYKLRCVIGTSGSEEVRVFKLKNGEGSVDDTVTFPTEITVASTNLSKVSHEGMFKMNDFKSSSDQTATVPENEFTSGDAVNIWRKGSGNVEIIEGTNVIGRGIRNANGKFRIKDQESPVALIFDTANTFRIFGNLEPGLSAITITSYDSLTIEENQTKNITVIGSGFTPETTVSATNATVNTVTYVDSGELTLNITATGAENLTIDLTYNNGFETVDTDAVTIGFPYLVDAYSPEYAYHTGKMSSTQTYSQRWIRLSDNAETDIGFDVNGKLSGTSPVSAGGDLATWLGSSDAERVKWYNQGTAGATFDVTYASGSRPKTALAGVIVVNDGWTMADHDGTNDYGVTDGADSFTTEGYTIFEGIRLKTLSGSNVFSGCYSPAPNRLYQVQSNAGTLDFHHIRDNDATYTSQIKSGGSLTVNTNHKIMVYWNPTAWDVLLDGVGTGDTSGSPSTASQNSMAKGIGAITNGAAPMNGYNSYHVFFKSDKSSNYSEIQNIIDSKL